MHVHIHCLCMCILCSVVMSISTTLLSQVKLYQSVTELAVSDFSVDVRVAAWKSLQAWHGRYTQMGMSSGTTVLPTLDSSPNLKGPPVFSAFSEQQNASHTNKALMVSMNDEDHKVQSHAVQAAEQILVVSLGQFGSGSTCDCGGTPGDMIERVGRIDFHTFFARRNWEEIHCSVAEQVSCSSENLLQLLSTGCDTVTRCLTEEVKAFYASLQQTLVSTLEAVNSSAAFFEKSPVDELILTLKEIVSATEAEDSKFAEADCN